MDPTTLLNLLADASWYLQRLDRPRPDRFTLDIWWSSHGGYWVAIVVTEVGLVRSEDVAGVTRFVPLGAP